MLRALFLKKETTCFDFEFFAIFAYELGFEILQRLSICARSIPLSRHAGLHPSSTPTYFLSYQKSLHFCYRKNMYRVQIFRARNNFAD